MPAAAAACYPARRRKRQAGRADQEAGGLHQIRVHDGRCVLLCHESILLTAGRVMVPISQRGPASRVSRPSVRRPDAGDVASSASIRWRGCSRFYRFSRSVRMHCNSPWRSSPVPFGGRRDAQHLSRAVLSLPGADPPLHLGEFFFRLVRRGTGGSAPPLQDDALLSAAVPGSPPPTARSPRFPRPAPAPVSR